MNIVVAIKQVPDSAAKIMVDSGVVNWGDAPLVMNPWDEFAIESALVQAGELGANVIAISIGEERAKEALKTALAMGVNEAVLISDPALVGADSQAVARVLAAAINKVGEVGLAFFGRQAIDGDMGVTAVQSARVLNWPVLTLVAAIQNVTDQTIRAECSFDEGRQIVESKIPVVISVSKDIGEPRYPSFMGIRKASRTVIPTWSLADIGVQMPLPAVRWPEIFSPQTSEITTEIITGASPQEMAEALVDKILAEKVL